MNGSFTCRLDAFEGPLDLLLFLIAKHKLNIYDIEISLLLEQYLEFMDAAADGEHGQSTDFEAAGEFLEMAARLIYIKTASLLPKPDEAQQLKSELEGRLIEYSLCKLASQGLAKAYIGGESFVREPMKLDVDRTYTGTHSPEALREAYMGIFSRLRKAQPIKASVFEPIVSRRIVSVTSKIFSILKSLYTCRSCTMDRLYEGAADKSERVATFLAVLELTKSGRIRLSDDNMTLYFVGRQKERGRSFGKSGAASAQTDGGGSDAEVQGEGDDGERGETLPTKVNLWNNPAVMRHYTIAQGTLRKANYWGYIKKGKSLCR